MWSCVWGWYARGIEMGRAEGVQESVVLPRPRVCGREGMSSGRSANAMSAAREAGARSGMVHARRGGLIVIAEGERPVPRRAPLAARG